MGVKISELPEATTSTSQDVVPIVQEDETKQIEKSIFLSDYLQFELVETW